MQVRQNGFCFIQWSLIFPEKTINNKHFCLEHVELCREENDT